VTRSLRVGLRVIAAAAIGCALPASLAAAQGARPPEAQEVEQLVVMIHCKVGDEETIGAGIMFGAANDRLYIVTANHVVRPRGVSATQVTVELRALPGEPVPATLLTTFDGKRDLAVLSIPGAAALHVDSATIPFDRLGDATALGRGDGVYALGYPQGQPWGVNIAPAPVATTSDSLVTFETSLVSPGHSGGALLNERWEVVGLLLNVQPPTATARSISQIVDMLREWRYPVALRRHAETNRVVVSATMTGQAWMVYVDIAERHIKEVFYRADTSVAFTSTGTMDIRDLDTGLPLPYRYFNLPFLAEDLNKGRTVYVKYSDSHGRQHGPYQVSFDGKTALVKTAKLVLAQTPHWLVFMSSPESQGDSILVGFSAILGYKNAFREIRYSVDSRVPSRHLRFVPDWPAFGGGVDKDEFMVHVSAQAKYVCVALSYIDGTDSAVECFDTVLQF